MKGKKNVRFTFIAVAVIALLSTGICAYMFINESRIKNEGRDYYAALVSVVEISTANTDYDLNELLTKTDAEPIAEISEPWTSIVDFDALAEIYPDIVAWININETNINYPIMQGDDNDFYLNHLPDGTPHKMGSIYMDCDAKPDFSNQNTLIFGHYLSAGGMFTDLEKYKEQEFYDENPVITLHTREKDYAVLLFSGHIVSGSNPFIERNFNDDDAYDAYIRELQRLSVFTSKNETLPDTHDRLVSLVTCSYEFKNARFILTGKLVEIGGL